MPLFSKQSRVSFLGGASTQKIKKISRIHFALKKSTSHIDFFWAPRTTQSREDEKIWSKKSKMLGRRGNSGQMLQSLDESFGRAS